MTQSIMTPPPNQTNTLHSLFGVKVTETKGVGLPVSPVEGDTVVCPLTGVALGPAVGVAEGV